MGDRFIVETEKDSWSEVIDTDGEFKRELWRYAWEAQERAEELNKRHGHQLTPAHRR